MPKTFTDEIEDMLGDLAPEDSEEVEETEETAEVEETETEDVDESGDTEEVKEVEDDSKEAEVEEVSKTEEESDEEETSTDETEVEKTGADEEEPTGAEEPDEVTDEVTALRGQLNQMSEVLLKHGIVLSDGQETAPVTEAAEPAQVATLEDLAILDEDVNFDDMMNDRETFVTTMRGILGRYRDLLSQDFSRAIPSVVANQVRQVSTLTNAVNTFYTENEDLLPVRKAVGVVANQIVAEHPDWDLPRVMQESAQTTRKMLKMKAPKRSSGKVVKPSFAKSKSARGKSKPKVSKLQSEIDAVID
jgi:hypothetical protein